MSSTQSAVAPARVPMVRPSLPAAARLWQRFQETLRTGQLTNGRRVREFEERVCAYLETPHAVALSSCTLGLTLALRALELQGEVVVPSFTFFATGHALLWNNLVPVFCDSEVGSFNIDPERVERLIGPRTSAIMAVHLYGNPAHAERLEQIAQKHRLRLVFDAAHAFGSRYEGRRVGAFGDLEVFSLSPTKVFTAGEGGLVTTRHSWLAASMRKSRNYGDPGTYDCDMLGLNARMTEFQALLGMECMRAVDAEISSRNEIADTFTRNLDGLPGISFQSVRAGDLSTRKDYSILVDEKACPVNRAQIAAALREANIDTRYYFSPPLHRQKLYRHFYRPAEEPLDVATRLSEQVLSLPIYSSLSANSISRITTVIRRTVERASRFARGASVPAR